MDEPFGPVYDCMWKLYKDRNVEVEIASASAHPSPSTSDVFTDEKDGLVHGKENKLKREQQGLSHFHPTNSHSEFKNHAASNNSVLVHPSRPVLFHLSMNEIESYESLEQSFHRNFLAHGHSFILTPEDKQVSTDYQFVLFSQVQRGSVSTGKENRKINTARIDDLTTLRCRFCSGHEGGQFSPCDMKNLQSCCSSSIHNHLLTCPKCPSEIKSALVLLKQSHRRQASNLKPAKQYFFYRRLWERIINQDYVGGNRQMSEIITNILFNILLHLSHMPS